MHASGTVGLGDPARVPFRLGVEVIGLELDERTRTWSSRTFPKAAGLWADFKPSGRVDLDTDLVARAARWADRLGDRSCWRSATCRRSTRSSATGSTGSPGGR